MSSKQRMVLVVEDDTAIRRGLADSLAFAGYGVLECGDGREARRVLLGAELDLVLLDVMLPGCDGFELLPEIRKNRPTLPVIFVTARGAEEDRVRGLRGGADDYVVKPFSSSELLARRAVLRRSPAAARRTHPARRRTDDRFPASGVLPPTRTRQLSSASSTSCVTWLLARARSRHELLAQVWGLDPRGLETRAIDMHVARLREKLDEPAGIGRILVTVRAKGYMLGEDVEVVEP
jgi:DNA-binding response OmpR family regulator